MSTKSLAVRILASVIILSFPLTTSPILAGAGTASLSGQLIAASSYAPLEGARLHLEDSATGTSYVSTPAGADGRFDVAAVPASSYRVAVESNGGLYVVDTPLKLDAGEERHLRLAVRQSSMGKARSGGASGSGSGKGSSAWSNPLTATLIVVGAAIVVGVIVDNATNNNDETSASASTP